MGLKSGNYVEQALGLPGKPPWCLPVLRVFSSTKVDITDVVISSGISPGIYTREYVKLLRDISIASVR